VIVTDLKDNIVVL